MKALIKKTYQEMAAQYNERYFDEAYGTKSNVKSESKDFAWFVGSLVVAVIWIGFIL